MAMFVHIAPESQLARIRRNGITGLRRRGVFAVPVTRDFYISHQWLRELRRRGGPALVGIYFRIPDSEMVWVGHYGQTHILMTAAEAVAEFLKASSKEGWEVIIPRRIDPTELHKTRSLPQVIGWRYYPKAKGRQPCTCEYCTRGDYGAKKLRERVDKTQIK